MAKAKKFKYDVRFTITSATELKTKDVKAAVAAEVGYVTDTFEDAKVGKVDVQAAE